VITVDTITRNTGQQADAPVVVPAPRQGLVAWLRSLSVRARARLSGVFVTLAMLVSVPSAAHAAAPVPPSIGDTAQEAAGQLSNGLLDGFVAILPYVIPVLVTFTVVGYVWKMLSAKKRAS
jgi:hypothetical protein